MNNTHPSSAPSKIRILQQNVRRSNINQQYVLQQADPADYDIILLQEPWFDHLGKSRGNRSWRILYPTNYYVPHDPIRSIILVNTNISTDAYTALDIPHSDITAIRLAGEFGHCSIFNIYNDCTNNNTTDALDTYLQNNARTALPSPSDHMFWLGDFNRHHPIWEPDTNRHLYSTAALVDPLLDLITNHDMIQSLPPGIPTLETVTHNWTRPDNVWRSNNANDPIVRCDVDPSIRPPKADHLPIITELDLSISRTSPPPTRNMRTADFTTINEKLQERLTLECPATRITSKDELNNTVNKLVKIMNEVIDEEVPATRPSPFAKRWWTKELTELKKEKNRLSRISYRYRATLNHPVHNQHREAANKLCNRIEETKREHWTDWLEDATSKDVYTANKYLTSEPSDYSSARIPDLRVRTGNTGPEITVTENIDKAKALADTFFPPPPDDPEIPPFAYPEPLKAKGIFSRTDIRNTIKKLKPYKAPGDDGIQNIVLQRCVETIINHLYYIFRAILELDEYPERWLIILTIVLRKAGKTNYNQAKSFRPIGLLDTIGKLFSTLVVADISYLAEKHNLLPPTQFGGRPGRTTTDAMHLIVQKIHDAWRVKKVAAILFLDVQAAFPNTVKERLLHNLKKRRVPDVYVRLIERMLTNRQTRLRFDDYTSDPINLMNGTTQGCPLSMLLYAFYNADLIEVAQGKEEHVSGFVDDCAFLAISNTLDSCHAILKDMMERSKGGFTWSFSHKSPFELTKIALQDYPRTKNDIASHPFVLNKPNHDGSTTPFTIVNVETYKYLGVIFDPKLKWRAHITRVVANATWWTQQLWRIAKNSGGMSPSRIRQLYNTVAVPAFTYACDVWYIPPFKQPHSKKSNGSVNDTKLLQSIQGTACRYITGAIRGTAFDVLETHANVLPIDLLFRKVQFRAATRLCALPSSHPLHATVIRTARRFVNKHRSPLHYLFFLTDLKPQEIEIINPVRRHPMYTPSLKTTISENKDEALKHAESTYADSQYKVYCDGSGHEGGIGAAAVLYKGDEVLSTVKYHLGPTTHHTVYEAELVGIILALHLLTGRLCQLLNAVIIGLDNQAAIKALTNQTSKPSHYLLDQIHDASERLQQQQDKLRNSEEITLARIQGRKRPLKKRGVCDLQIHWVPGHMDFEPNELADEHAKDAAKGISSPSRKLPESLKQPLPSSTSALRQGSKTTLQRRWTRRWKTSPRYNHIHSIDKSAPSKKWLKLVNSLSRKQSSIIVQLRTGRIGLNKHLHRIKKSDTPNCPHCPNIIEDIRHFLFTCPHYRRERHALQRELRRRSQDISYLLSSPIATLPLLKYVHATGRLKKTFGEICPP